MARQMARDLGLENVEVRCGDARATGLPHGAFDLATARLVLVNVPKPEQIMAEAVALVRPGGWVAFHEADWIGHICDPPSESWTAIVQLLVRYTEKNGIDLFVGRRLPGLLRAAGLTDIRVKPLIHVYPPGAPRRNILHDFVENSERAHSGGRAGGKIRTGPAQAGTPARSRRSGQAGDFAPVSSSLGSQARANMMPGRSGTMTEMIDIKAFIDSRPIAPFLWALVAMCFLIVVADGMDVAIMGFVTPVDPAGLAHLAAGLRPCHQRGAPRPRHRGADRGPLIRPAWAQDRVDELGAPVRHFHGHWPQARPRRRKWRCCACSPAWAWGRRCRTPRPCCPNMCRSDAAPC